MTNRHHLFSLWVIPGCKKHVESDFPCEVIEGLRLWFLSLLTSASTSCPRLSWSLSLSPLLNLFYVLSSFFYWTINILGEVWHLKILVCSWIHSQKKCFPQLGLKDRILGPGLKFRMLLWSSQRHHRHSAEELGSLNTWQLVDKLHMQGKQGSHSEGINPRDWRSGSGLMLGRIPCQ